VDVTDVSSLVH